MRRIRQQVRTASGPPQWLFALLVLSLAAPASGQVVLDRSPNLSGGWVGVPGDLYALAPHRFRDVRSGAGVDIEESMTFDLALGLPARLLAGARFAPSSRTFPGESDEWEPYGRWAAFEAGRGAPLDVSLTAAYNTAAEGAVAALSAARWLGPLRLLAEARVLQDPDDEVRAAAAGGAVLHVVQGSLPIALAADLGGRFQRPPGDDIAWSAGLHIGLPYTAYTLSLHASNADATTLFGTSSGGGRTWYGFEVTIPVTTPGKLLGMVAARERALEGVVADAPEAGAIRRAAIRRYAFDPLVIVIDAGTTIEWVNEDDVLHTVNADDASFESGAIPPGSSWRARFDLPGTYPFFCGPHPFMRGSVVVR